MGKAIEKNIFLTKWEIYEKINTLKIKYDMNGEKGDLLEYIDNNSNVLVYNNPTFDEAWAEIMADELQDKYDYAQDI